MSPEALTPEATALDRRAANLRDAAQHLRVDLLEDAALDWPLNTPFEAKWSTEVDHTEIARHMAELFDVLPAPQGAVPGAELLLCTPLLDPTESAKGSTEGSGLALLSYWSAQATWGRLIRTRLITNSSLESLAEKSSANPGKSGSWQPLGPGLSAAALTPGAGRARRRLMQSAQSPQSEDTPFRSLPESVEVWAYGNSREKVGDALARTTEKQRSHARWKSVALLGAGASAAGALSLMSTEMNWTGLAANVAFGAIIHAATWAIVNEKLLSVHWRSRALRRKGSSETSIRSARREELGIYLVFFFFFAGMIGFLSNMMFLSLMRQEDNVLHTTVATLLLIINALWPRRQPEVDERLEFWKSNQSGEVNNHTAGLSKNPALGLMDLLKTEASRPLPSADELGNIHRRWNRAAGTELGRGALSALSILAWRSDEARPAARMTQSLRGGLRGVAQDWPSPDPAAGHTHEDPAQGAAQTAAHPAGERGNSVTPDERVLPASTGALSVAQNLAQNRPEPARLRTQAQTAQRSAQETAVSALTLEQES